MGDEVAARLPDKVQILCAQNTVSLWLPIIFEQACTPNLDRCFAATAGNMQAIGVDGSLRRGLGMILKVMGMLKAICLLSRSVPIFLIIQAR